MGVHMCSYYCDRPECVRAQRDELRQAIEQAEDAVVAEREACAKLVEDFDFTFQDDSAGSLEDAARAIRARGTPVHASDIPQERVDETAKDRHEWVEITKGECDELFRAAADHIEYAYAIEAKLKEKNSP